MTTDRRTTAAPVARLVDEFHRLPGIGPKTAQRLAYYLIRMPEEQARSLAETAESKISLVILSLVPFAALALMATSQGDAVSRLLGESRHLLGIGVGMIVAGIFVAWLIVRSART